MQRQLKPAELIQSTTPDPLVPCVGQWSSFEELIGEPEFRKWLEQEFPEGTSEFGDQRPGVNS